MFTSLTCIQPIARPTAWQASMLAARGQRDRARGTSTVEPSLLSSCREGVGGEQQLESSSGRTRTRSKHAMDLMVHCSKDAAAVPASTVVNWQVVMQCQQACCLKITWCKENANTTCKQSNRQLMQDATMLGVLHDSATLSIRTNAGVKMFMISPDSILLPCSGRMPCFAQSAPAPLSSATLTTGSAAVAAS